MAKVKPTPFLTSDHIPCNDAEFRWVFIDQPGKKGPNEDSKMRLVASLYVKTESDGCKALSKLIKGYWKDNKPKGAKLKSLGFKVAQVKADEPDEDGEDVYVDTDETVFNFWTSTHWPDGSEHVIDIYNAKGKKISLCGKKIGNGSKSSISGAMGTYDNGPSARGVTLYLNAIQLTKFVEFTTDAGFASQEDEMEGGFEGVESDFAGTVQEEGSDAEARPNL